MKNSKLVYFLVLVMLLNFVFTGCGKDEYRLVNVEKYSGTVTVERDSESMSAFEGMKLVSDDFVNVGDDSDLSLLVDTDKYVYAEANTSFSLVATGNPDKGLVRFDLKNGKGLFQIDSKLPDGSSFEVSTPNAIFCVRGTKFSVAYNEETNTTELDVMEGTVEAKYLDDTTEYVEAGNYIVVSEDAVERGVYNTGSETQDGDEFYVQLTMFVDIDARTEHMSANYDSDNMGPDLVFGVEYRDAMLTDGISFRPDVPGVTRVTYTVDHSIDYIEDAQLATVVRSIANDLYDNYVYVNADELESDVRDIIASGNLSDSRFLNNIDTMVMHDANGVEYAYNVEHFIVNTNENGYVLISVDFAPDESERLIDELGLRSYVNLIEE